MWARSTGSIELPDQVAALLAGSGKPVEAAAREPIIGKMYRRHALSRGRAAELLELDLDTFLQRAGRLGIAYVDMTAEEWAAEMKSAQNLAALLSSSPTIEVPCC